MSKRVIKQLSDMAIDEVSLVDRGANQHALIAIAKRADPVADLFAKARGARFGNDEADVDEVGGDDPAGVVDDDVANDGAGDVGPGETISGTEKTSAKDVSGKSAKGKTKAAPKVPGKMEDKVETHTHKGEHNLPKGVKETTENDDMVLAKALGLVVDGYEIEKGFGPQDPQAQQQGQQAPQFGNPPASQTVGAMPFGQGAPQQPQGTPSPFGGGGFGPAGPNPQNPGMASGGPQVPGPTSLGAQNALGGGMGMASQMGQTGVPAQLNVAQLPPEVVQYIQSLEQQLAQAQGQNEQNPTSSPQGSDSSNSSSDADGSNKPFGKSGAAMNEDLFLTELSKALRDEDSAAEISKALQTRFEEYDAEIAKAHQAAADERDLRLEREFIAKAAEFTVPVPADELGPVLKRAAESLTIEDFSVIVKCLDAATELSTEVFGEIGKRGTGANSDILNQVELAAGEITKSANVSGAQAIAEVFEANPQAYDEYRSTHPGFGRF